MNYGNYGDVRAGAGRHASEPRRRGVLVTGLVSSNLTLWGWRVRAGERN